MFNFRITLFFILVFAANLAAQTKPELTVAKIMQGSNYVGNLPSDQYWSEDNEHIYFDWNPENADDDSLYRISIKNIDSAPEKVPARELKNVPSKYGVYTRDYSKKVFTRDGDIFFEDIKNNNRERITTTFETEKNVRFNQDETALIFQKENGLYSWNINSGRFRQIVQFKSGKNPSEETKTELEKFTENEELRHFSILRERKEKKVHKKISEDQQKDIPVIYIGSQTTNDPQLSPDGKFVTTLLAHEHDAIKTEVPTYVDESGHAKMLSARSKVGSSQQKYKFAVIDLEKETLTYVKQDDLPEIFDHKKYTETKLSEKKEARDVKIYGPTWSDDGKNGFVEIRSDENKDRWLALVDLPSGKLTSFEHQNDEAWIGGPNISAWNNEGEVGWMPDNKRIWFCSEESGYSHIYTYDTVTKSKKAITSGSFEIFYPTISGDKKYWHFRANKDHPGEVHYYRLKIDGNGDLEKILSIS